MLGLAGAMGAFDRDAGPDCDPGVAYAVGGDPGLETHYTLTPPGTAGGYIPPSAVQIPPDPAPVPLPENPPNLFVPGGSGTLVGIGGSGPMPLMVPAGGGTFMSMP